MKKISVMGIAIMYLSMGVVLAVVKFTDVKVEHWAYEFIEKMQYSNVINGYPDNTFQPDVKVKTGEFIKMVSMTLWPNFKYEAPKNGLHWAMPYVNSLNRVALKSSEYDGAKLEKNISRGEAVKILSKAFIAERDFREVPYHIDQNQTYIQKYQDLKSIKDDELKSALNICTQYGLITGFEDDTFRAEESLTRAQAAKIMCLLVEN